MEAPSHHTMSRLFSLASGIFLILAQTVLLLQMKRNRTGKLRIRAGPLAAICLSSIFGASYIFFPADDMATKMAKSILALLEAPQVISGWR